MLFVVCWFFSKSTFLKNYFRNTIRNLNSLDPDQAWHFVRPDLGPNCSQRLSADDTYIGGKELTGQQELHKRLQSSLKWQLVQIQPIQSPSILKLVWFKQENKATITRHHDIKTTTNYVTWLTKIIDFHIASDKKSRSMILMSCCYDVMLPLGVFFNTNLPLSLIMSSLHAEILWCSAYRFPHIIHLEKT